MKIDIIGSGTPSPASERFGSCYVVNVGDERLMFDCGPASTHKLVKMGIPLTQIDNLFFTHHHFDHDVDYPCFILSRWNLCIGGERDLQVYGPNLTERITHRIMDENEGAFAHDWIAPINHPLSLNAFTSRGGVLPRPRSRGRREGRWPGEDRRRPGLGGVRCARRTRGAVARLSRLSDRQRRGQRRGYGRYQTLRQRREPRQGRGHDGVPVHLYRERGRGHAGGGVHVWERDGRQDGPGRQARSGSFSCTRPTPWTSPARRSGRSAT